MDDRYRITICEKLKQSKPGRHLAPIDLISFQSDKNLSEEKHLKEYLQRTKQLREEHSQLLINYVKPFNLVSIDTISRWISQVLESAGIGINKYSARNSRAASTSSCKAKGLSPAMIMQSAGWSYSSTFSKFYDKPVDTASANFGSVLVNADILWSVELYHSFLEFGNNMCPPYWILIGNAHALLMWLLRSGLYMIES